jgi:protein phosphatase
MIKDVKVDCFGLTDCGKVRKVNQDQFLIATMHKMLEIQQTSLPNHTRERLTSGAVARLILVADGVGGGAAGEEASGLALEAVAYYVTTSMQCFYKLEEDLEADLLSALETSVHNSHRMVQSAAASSPEYTGMATTLTVAHILWPRIYIVHVGDSRAYMLRGRDMSQLTRDQTLAQGLVDEGVMSPDSAERSPLSHVLSSAVGKEITPATSSVEVESGDVLLLCTDGLTKHVTVEQIRNSLAAGSPAEETCRTLVTAALDGGGSDNVTAVVCRFT